MTGEPFPLFREMRRVRSRMYAALERRLWPRDQSELYFLLAALNCLMAVAADDLGYRPAAEELARAGWAYAVVIDHRPVMAHLRLHLSRISYSQRPRHSRDLAASALEYVADGPNAAYAQLMYGRAAAHLGDAHAARRAITAASDARDRDHHDDLLEIGGEFDLSRATQQYLAGAALIEVPDAEADVVTELEQAVDLYAAGPGTGETHGFGMQALTRIDLATAQLQTGQLDAAAALAPVLALASSQRIDALSPRLDRVRAELARPRYQGSSQASDLDERIEDFSRDTIGRELHELPMG
jgi:predicted negative regulator of RcsB-dependent stress response